MKNFRVTLAAGVLAAAMNPISPAHSSQDPPKPTQGVANIAGSHDFDFQVGEWRVHHRVKRPAGNDQWLEFDGTCSNRGLMDGSANVEDQRFDKPTGEHRRAGHDGKFSPRHAQGRLEIRWNSMIQFVSHVFPASDE